MRRIIITGNAGAGKTTLSGKLGELLGLPVVSLEKVVWDPGWVHVSKEEVQRRLDPILQKEKWIIDGVSTRACEAADTVIFLDFPRVICLGRALRRSLRHIFKQRPELPENCPEISILWGMTKIIFQFPRITRPKILRLLDENAGRKTVVRIRSLADLRQFLASISSQGLSLSKEEPDA